jgi:predicted RNA-binding Zn-ribbon protein involved in translation (DUF1610 family)
MTPPIQGTLFPPIPRRDRAAYFRERRRKQGAISRSLLRSQAIDSYNENPKYCKECGKLLEIKEKESLRDALKRVFCNRKCASAFTNRLKKKKGICISCGREARRTSKAIRKFCDDCLDLKRVRDLGEITKGSLFSRLKGYQSARSQIRRHAELVFIRSGKPKSCSICQYSLYVEIAHLRSVSDFPGSALLREINAIENLIIFCANHHWEFDNDQLLNENSWCGAQVAV